MQETTPVLPPKSPAHLWLARHPWLRNSEPRHVIMGDDLDAALSTLLYLRYNPGAVVSGVYTGFETLYHGSHLTPDDLADCVYLDLDIYHPQCRSLGHHIVRYSPDDVLPALARSCNLNEYAGRSVTRGFHEKYPLGTVHHLLWLYDAPLPEHPLAEPLLWLADSSFINGQTGRFAPNVARWLREWLPHPALLRGFENIDTLAFEEKTAKIQAFLAQNGFKRGKGQARSRHLQLTGFQCQPVGITHPDALATYLMQLLHVLADVTGWHWQPGQVALTDLRVTRGQRHTCSVENVLNNGGLSRFLLQNNVFSYAFPYKDCINFTRLSIG